MKLTAIRCLPTGLLRALLLVMFAMPSQVIEHAHAETGPYHVLKQRIIRSIAVHPDDPQRILVGNKGKAAGAALVFESRDRGRTWRTLNRGRPLAPTATDVQAVAYAGGGTILAGTWKRGLYVSRDDGETFERHAGFPGKDIRDLVVADGGTLLYAATPRQGIYKSHDRGITWSAIGPDKAFFWSIHVSPDGQAVDAVSLEKAVYHSSNGGYSWQRIFENANAYALARLPSGSTWLATEDGVFRAAKFGAAWRRVGGLPAEKFSSVLATPDHGRLYAGSWTSGVYVLDGADDAARDPVRLLPDLPVVHLRRSGRTLLIGTWGQGLHVVPLD